MIAIGSLGGVAAARRGECDVAPVHLVDPDSGIYNMHLVTPGLSLARGWRRMQGIVYRPGDGRFEARDAARRRSRRRSPIPRASWSTATAAPAPAS